MRKYLFVLSIVAVVAVIALPAVAALHAAGGAGLPVAPIYASLGGVHSESACTATAQCATGTVSCSGSSTCIAVDRNCSANPPQDGYVECDGVWTDCTPTCGCNVFIRCGGGPGSLPLECQGQYYCNSAEGCWVTCDFHTTYCPDAPPDCPYPN